LRDLWPMRRSALCWSPACVRPAQCISAGDSPQLVAQLPHRRRRRTFHLPRASFLRELRFVQRLPLGSSFQVRVGGDPLRFNCAALAGAVLAAAGCGLPFQAKAADPDSGPSSETPQGSGTQPLRLESVQITGERFDKARNGLSPKTGSSRFLFDQRDIDLLPLGESTSLNSLMLQAPGVVQGDYGELHIRGEMAQPQYRINGTIIPEGIGGFGQAFDLRFARRVDFITGALPAQYNYRTNVIDIETKQTFERAGKISLYGGSYGTFNPSAEVSGSVGNVSYFLTGSYLQAKNGILFPSPDRQALHNDTTQTKGFAFVSLMPDPQSRWTVMAGTAQSRFQIPNVAGQSPTFPLDGDQYFPDLPSAELDENQRERNRYGVVSYQSSIRSNADYQVALYSRTSSVQFTPDVIGDLIYRGIASHVERSNQANGLQLDSSLEVAPAHTVRAGLSASRQRTDSANESYVFPADANGAQVPGLPFVVADARSLGATLAGLYVQDEWRASAQLTVNYGLRFDYLDGLTRESQFSPRLNGVYKVGNNTALHAGYARFFNPPRLELIGPDTVAKFSNTTNQPEVQEASPVVPERVHYFDLGLTHQPIPGVNLGANAYAKYVSHMIDFGQFGQALVYSPFNWAKAKVYGLELTGQYRNGDLSAAVNGAVSWARAKGISSGEYNFGRDELDYINGNWVYMDHDQRFTSSASVAYKWSGVLLAADAFFGSGMRRTPEGGTPNSSHLPSYLQVNIGVGREFQTWQAGKLSVRLSAVNLFDRSYEVRDGTGVGVGAPQFGPRRSLYATLIASF